MITGADILKALKPHFPKMECVSVRLVNDGTMIEVRSVMESSTKWRTEEKPGHVEHIECFGAKVSLDKIIKNTSGWWSNRQQRIQDYVA